MNELITVFKSTSKFINSKNILLATMTTTQLVLGAHAVYSLAATKLHTASNTQNINKKIYLNRVSRVLPDLLSVAMLGAFIGRWRPKAGLAAAPALGLVIAYGIKQHKKSVAEKIYAPFIPILLLSSALPLAQQAAHLAAPFGTIATYSAPSGVAALSMSIFGLVILQTKTLNQKQG